MRICETKVFGRFARKADIDDACCGRPSGSREGTRRRGPRRPRDQEEDCAVGRREVGRVRTIILFKAGERAFYVFGFSKSELGNIEDYELAAFKKLAAKLLAYSDEELSRAIETGALVEVT